MNSAIRKVNLVSGIISTICTGLNSPTGVVVSTGGLVYFADSLNHKVKQLALDNSASTYAGNGMQGSTGDVIRATAAKLNTPYGVLYIVESVGRYIRSVQPSTGNLITYVAGNGGLSTSSLDANGDGGYRLDETMVTMNKPLHIWGDGNGNVYFADSLNNKVRIVYSNADVSHSDQIQTILGDGTFDSGGEGVAATSERFKNPSGVWGDSVGNLLTTNTLGNTGIQLSFWIMSHTRWLWFLSF
eukprot:gene26290-32852_t